MARTRPPAPAVQHSMVASAARIRGGLNITGVSRDKSGEAWHDEAWAFYRRIGEFRFSCDWVGSMLSKAILSVVEKKNGEKTPVTTGTAAEILDSLFGDDDGKAEMLRQIGIHMSVTGECHIVGYPDPDPFSDGGDKWEVAASTKCKRPANDSGSWIVNDVTLPVDPNDVVAVRIWRPDPLDPQRSISPARALLGTLSILDKLSQHIAAQVESRLAGAGILLVPSEITFPAPPEVEGAEQRTANNAEDLMEVLGEAMAKAIKNRGDASALVPIVITAPGDVIEKVQHLTFWTELDEKAIEMRTEAIRRLALGMDMPPEVLQGAADSNHWSAWQADEAAIKSHTEPLLKIITTALATGYLRPLIKDEVEDVRAISILADTSEMRLRPNRSKEALELYNIGELSGKALLRETGFDDADAMDDKERALWHLRKVASGSTTPELVEAALAEIGVKLDIVRPAGPEADTQEARPAPSLKDHPVQEIPDPKVSERRKQARDEGRVPSADIERKASLLAASEQVVIRALERAGNKLKSKMGVKPTCAAADIYKFVATAEDAVFLLQDAWGHVPPIAERAGINPGHLTSILDDYTTDLLDTQHPHTYDRFTAHVTRALEELESAA